MADKKVTEFAVQTPSATDTLLAIKSDGTCYRSTIEAAVAGTDVVTAAKERADVFYDSAAAHNALYRGKDLTEYFDSGEASKAIAAGTFAGIYPGDYLLKSVTVDGVTYNNQKFVVGDLDYHLHRGDTETTAHHVLLYAENQMGAARMNETDTTAGGYVSSEMWQTTIPKYVAGIQAAFGTDHVLSHRELLTNAMNADADSAAGANWKGSSYWDWNDTEKAPWQTVLVNIFNSAMWFGHAPLASSGFDTGDCSKQIASLRHSPSVSRNWCWLRDVASYSDFAAVLNGGLASSYGASYSRGVRPYFLYR